MLRRLLRLAAGRGTGLTDEIAREIGVSPALAEQMLEDLARRGYLRLLVEGCASPCEGCPEHEMCLPHAQPRVWTLTQKGEHALSKGTDLSSRRK